MRPSGRGFEFEGLPERLRLFEELDQPVAGGGWGRPAAGWLGLAVVVVPLVGALAARSSWGGGLF